MASAFWLRYAPRFAPSLQVKGSRCQRHGQNMIAKLLRRVHEKAIVSVLGVGTRF